MRPRWGSGAFLALDKFLMTALCEIVGIIYVTGIIAQANSFAEGKTTNYHCLVSRKMSPLHHEQKAMKGECSSVTPCRSLQGLSVLLLIGNSLNKRSWPKQAGRRAHTVDTQRAPIHMHMHAFICMCAGYTLCTFICSKTSLRLVLFKLSCSHGLWLRLPSSR